MKSKKQKKGGANTNPLFTGFGINDVNKLLDILFLIGLFLVIILLVIIGPNRLLEIYKELVSNINRNIETIVEEEQQYSTRDSTPPRNTVLTQRIPNTPPQHQMA
tara:strand:- start:1487 stop:1801 length:315 start_codon:yes stop_codon:yes gene_type:complete